MYQILVNFLEIAQGIEALSNAGARSVAYFNEEQSAFRGMCGAIPELAAKYNLDVLNATEARLRAALC